jgi:hypothetical protein
MALVTVTGPTQAMSVNTRYVADRSPQAVQFTALPTSPRVGDEVAITGVGTGGWALNLVLGQILVDPSTGTIGTQPNWTSTGSGNAGWNPMAADAAGNTVFAGASNTVRASSDGGGSWSISLTVPGVDWRGIALSADGLKVVAGGSNNALRVSADGGQTWSTPAGVSGIGGNNTWERVGMSDDGATILLAGDFASGSVYLSKDGGATFAQAPNVPAGGSWVSASVSADATKMIASQNATIGQNATIVSTDGGTTWTRITAPAGMHNSVVSADGSTFVGITHQGTDNTAYVSRDNGATWTKTSLSIGQGNLLRVAVSADGKTIGASTFGGQTWLSFNGGASWVGNGSNQLWYGLAVSRDGQRAFTADTQGASPVQVANPSVDVLIGQRYSSITLQYMGSETWLFTEKAGTVFASSND